jgi:hypothetical protein
VSALTRAMQEFVQQKESGRRQGQERIASKTREWTAWKTEHALRIERNVPAWYAELARLESQAGAGGTKHRRNVHKGM